MASRRKKRKNLDIDPLGGFSLDELLGADPVSVVDKKQGLIGRVIGLPFRLIAALIKIPFKLLAAVAAFPVRVLKATFPPYRRVS